MRRRKSTNKKIIKRKNNEISQSQLKSELIKAQIEASKASEKARDLYEKYIKVLGAK